MPGSEFVDAIVFYLVFSAFGFCGLPLFDRPFRGHAALAWFAAKIVGVAAFGYVVWIACSTPVLDFQRIGILRAPFGVAVIGGGAWLIGRRPASWKAAAKAELIALPLYMLHLWLRAHQPTIFDTEHLMDMALFTSSGRTNHFPFADPWNARETVNYYYHGQYLMVLLTRLAGLRFSVGYNCAIALLYSASAMLAGLMTVAVARRKWAGWLAGFLTTTAGTALYATCALAGVAAQRACPYTNASRPYSPAYAIFEHPSYSFTLGNLHAHLIALPFFLTGLIWLWRWMRSLTFGWRARGTLALMIATAGLVNPADLITLSLLVCLVAVVRGCRKWMCEVWVMAAAVPILFLPFIIHFRSPIQGVAFAPAFAASHHLSGVALYPTPWRALLGLWGIPVMGLGALPISRATARPITAMFLGTAMLLIIGMELFFVRDIYYFENPRFFRSYTTFKFGFHAWVLLSLGFAMATAGLVRSAGWGRYAGLALTATSVIVGAVYPEEAVRQFFLKHGFSSMPGLDGTDFLQTGHPQDYAAIRFLLQQEKRGVVVEATGDSYTYFGRISAFSGMAAPVNWKTHEWTWRFQPPVDTPQGAPDAVYESLARAEMDVQLIYESDDLEQTRSLLRKYRAEFLFIGDLERARYRSLNAGKFNQLGQVVFAAGRTIMYRVKN